MKLRRHWSTIILRADYLGIIVGKFYRELSIELFHGKMKNRFDSILILSALNMFYLERQFSAFLALKITNPLKKNIINLCKIFMFQWEWSLTVQMLHSYELCWADVLLLNLDNNDYVLSWSSTNGGCSWLNLIIYFLKRWNLDNW